MKKNDLLSKKSLKPRLETVKMLLQFSKSIAVIETQTNKFIVSKN